MTGKRFKKLLMAKGASRDEADFILRHIRMYGPDGKPYSHADILYKAKIEVIREEKK